MVAILVAFQPSVFCDKYLTGSVTFNELSRNLEKIFSQEDPAKSQDEAMTQGWVTGLVICHTEPGLCETDPNAMETGDPNMSFTQ